MFLRTRSLVHWRRGDAQATLRCLDEAALTRDPNLIYAPTDPAFTALRGNPKFASMLRRHRRPAQ